VDIVPQLFEVIGPGCDVHRAEATSLLGLPPAARSRSSQLVKRIIDLFGAVIGLVITAPFFALVAVLIKAKSPGPVFFRQTRLGKDMRAFTLLKFRTMKTDTDERVHEEFIEATMRNHDAPSEDGLFKLAREDAVTQIGAWLRRTSLDELPQLINVLRGEMSLVGPRPCIPYEVKDFKPHHFDRFLVPAGMTGFWQTCARAHATYAEALDMDALYAQSWSLGLDFLILARTPAQLLCAKVTR
jgi:lipopolysaccharide/colanic/teichoic acid biosynthesis glycosyltransferase